MIRILVVEDDKTIALGIEYTLKQEGFEVIVCYNAEETRSWICNSEFSLAILDLALPDGDGYELCKLIRDKSDTPVIFVTACDDEVNVVMGLDMGADDYITKPFRVKELLSRIKSVLRRYNKQAEQATEITLGNIKINTLEARVYKNSESIFLTKLEYKLLLTLANSQGQVLSRNQILEGIWDVAGDFVNDNTLTVYIRRLREKVEDDTQNPQIIKTIRGFGYRIGD